MSVIGSAPRMARGLEVLFMNEQELLAALLLSEQQRGLIQTLQLYYGADVKISLTVTRRVYLTGLDELCFSARSRNALRRASVNTVGDLIDALNDGRVEKLRNLGRKSVAEIKTRTLLFGFERLSERGKKQFFRSVIELNPERTAMIRSL